MDLITDSTATPPISWRCSTPRVDRSAGRRAQQSAGAIDQDPAVLLRSSSGPVLEGLRSGCSRSGTYLNTRQGRVVGARLADAPPGPANRARTLIGESGRPYRAPRAAARVRHRRGTRGACRRCGLALAAAARIGYPVVLKTDQPGIAHNSDTGGVILGIASPGELISGLCRSGRSASSGPAALIARPCRPGTELALGLIRDPRPRPAASWSAQAETLVELIADRRSRFRRCRLIRLPRLLAELKVSALLAGAEARRRLTSPRSSAPSPAWPSSPSTSARTSRPSTSPSRSAAPTARPQSTPSSSPR